MKSLIAGLLSASLFLNTGCMTHAVVEKARPTQKLNPKTKNEEIIPGHSGYYALLPLSIPADIVTLPFQIIAIPIYIVMVHSK